MTGSTPEGSVNNARLITCILPHGHAMPLLKMLKDEWGVNSAEEVSDPVAALHEDTHVVFDGVSGDPLMLETVRAARADELNYPDEMDVYAVVPVK